MFCRMANRLGQQQRGSSTTSSSLTRTCRNWTVSASCGTCGPHGECIQPGVIYIAPAGVHMRVEHPSDSRAIIFLDTHPDDYLHIPSIDVLMTSVAETFRNLALGVIMTGMGSDGSAGMRAIYRQGGLTIGQDETSCTVIPPATCPAVPSALHSR
ncbi:MAG TPA: CheB methylesterase domain-containing protein [Candidatus Sulfotelmatobacter sp.]